ncbi:MAG: PPC domain-containing protein [Pseudanabaenaceae cyanobacterium SKYGB_i_bin29]|nr:PPC domain-containing protein [Pseudanabaenaceae cyanobacterium SKYG29]MDW8421065.1 PPC domain-containing protein [Pseudanabaenaceae cyanobacterium SKYGB_i_bin29]
MEPNDSIALASFTGLLAGSTFRVREEIGNLAFRNLAETAPALDVDFYRVEMERGDILSLSLLPGGSLRTAVQIFDSLGVPVVSELRLTRFDFIAPASGAYFVAISSRDNISYDPARILSGTPLVAGSRGTYTLELTRHAGDFLLEPNDTIATAIPTGLSTQQPGAFVKSGFITAGDVDVFAVTLEAGDKLKVKTQTLRESNLDSFLRLFDAQGNLLASNDDARPDTRDAYLEFVAPNTGVYFLGLSDRTNATYNPLVSQPSPSQLGGGYIIAIAVDGAPPEQVLDDVPATAIPTGLSSALPGQRVFNSAIGNNAQGGRDRDLYSLEMSAGDRLVLRIDTPPLSDLDSVLRVFDAGGRELAFNDDDPGRNSQDSLLEFVAPVSGRFFVGVSDFANNAYDPLVLGSGRPGNTGSYRLTVTLEGRPGQEPNDSLPQATPLSISGRTPSVQVDGYIGNNPFLPAALDVDIYRLDLLPGMGITASVSILALSSGLIPGLKIFDSAGAVIAEDRSAAVPALATQFKTSVIEFRQTTGGTYFIGVSDVDNFDYSPLRPASGNFNGLIGNYQLTVTLTS